MERCRIRNVRRIPRTGNLGLGCLVLILVLIGAGCNSLLQARDLVDMETGEALESHALKGDRILAIEGTGGPEPDALIRTCIHRICAPQFRTRTLARETLLDQGPGILPFLVRAYESAVPGSRRRSSVGFLIERIQHRQNPRDLVAEMTGYRGIRQIAAIRAAIHQGTTLVPALLPLIAHPEARVRTETVIALRTITARHPFRAGLGGVEAACVWRDWYDRERARQRKTEGPPGRLRIEPPLPDPGMILSM